MLLTYYVVGYNMGCFQPVDVGYGNKRKRIDRQYLECPLIGTMASCPDIIR